MKAAVIIALVGLAIFAAVIVHDQWKRSVAYNAPLPLTVPGARP